MCGIFAYIGDAQDAANIIQIGLKRLEYRGYDSWGIAVLDKKNINVVKEVGAVGDLKTVLKLPQASIGIGHTRWATHGGVTQNNAHPHFSSNKKFVLAQNGIVENYESLKKTLLKKGYKFYTQTDTEVIVRLIEFELKSKRDLFHAMASAFKQLSGRNTIIILTDNGTILAARNGSPLVIGINKKTRDLYISSDTLSFSQQATDMLVVDNQQLVEIKDRKILLFDMNLRKIPVVFEKMTVKAGMIDKGKYPHFMLKEIHEGPYVIRQLLHQDEIELEKLAVAIKKAKTVYTIGSGTTGVAASQIAFYLRMYAGINATTLVGADAREYLNIFDSRDIIIAPSQSGETADVLEVLEVAKQKGMKIASYVNMYGSMMTRLSDYKFLAHAGPEICVMSTKIFISQIAWGYLVAKTVAGDYKTAKKNLESLAHTIELYLQDKAVLKQIKTVARYLSTKKDIFLLAKSQNYQIAREGMIKLIEGSYKHAHAIPAGDLKHYAITLMEKGVPVVALLSNDSVYTDVINAIHEVQTRGSDVIGITSKKIPSLTYTLPVPDLKEVTAIMNVVPLQLLAYHTANLLGHNVDKPRNIAKSVTVK